MLPYNLMNNHLTLHVDHQLWLAGLRHRVLLKPQLMRNKGKPLSSEETFILRIIITRATAKSTRTFAAAEMNCIYLHKC